MMMMMMMMKKNTEKCDKFTLWVDRHLTAEWCQQHFFPSDHQCLGTFAFFDALFEFV